MIQQKITPCLWVEKDAKAVAEYYLSIFKDGKLKDYRLFTNMQKDGNADNLNPDNLSGEFETAVMEIAGVEFSILAAGPLFNCKDQAEVDYYWEALTSNGGEEGPCGWCKDKYGLSWQVVPTEYFGLIHHSDPAISRKALMNTFKQKKLIISELK